MTDQQINEAIAEVCNWPGNLICRDFNGNLWPSDPPDFCRDLNAMHEAEKIVTSDCNMTYANQLARITNAHYSDDPAFFCATARQRAEAFLRTLGKWEEGK